MGRRPRDIAGWEFGRLTAVRPAGSSRHGNAMWTCRCECGVEVTAQAMILLRGGRVRCDADCPLGGVPRGAYPADLTGLAFGRWRVVGPAGRDAHHGEVLWLCRCECGATAEVRRGNLVSGHSGGCKGGHSRPPAANH